MTVIVADFFVNKSAYAELKDVILEMVSIQYLRGIAAFLVVAAHALLRIYGENHSVDSFGLKASYILGDMGVYIFFVISGFIMVFTSNGRYTKKGAVRHFLIKRIVRIVPLYWIMTTFSIFLIIRSGNLPDANAIAGSYFFLPISKLDGELRPLLAQGWTLNYEMYFYAIFSFTLIFRAGMGQLILVGIMVSLIFIGSIEKPLWDTRGPHTLTEFWTDPILLTFMTGVLLGIRKPAFDRHLRAFDPNILIVAATISISLAVIICLSVRSDLSRSYPIKSIELIFSIISVYICSISNKNININSKINYILSTMGNASFSTYLTHQFALRWSLMFIKTLSISNVLLEIILMVLISHLMGFVTFCFLELPLLRRSHLVLLIHKAALVAQSRGPVPTRRGAGADHDGRE